MTGVDRVRGPDAVREPEPRVLLACDFLLRYTARLAGGLAQQGAPVCLLTRDHDLEFGGGAEAGGQATRYVASRVGPRGRHVRVPGRVSDPRALPALAAATGRVRRWRPDVVHLQDSVASDPRLVLAAGALPGRFALTVHDADIHPGDEPLDRRQALVRTQLVRRAGLIFVHSEAVREQLRASARPSAPVEVVPHGTGTAEATPPPPEPTMLFFGRLVHYKGLDVLLDALPRIWARLPAARLIIAGEGPLPPHELYADPRVELRHRHIGDDELPGLFRRARCVVLPYREASQSGVGSQAKMYGRPLVSTTVGGLPELVADGSGTLVRPEDPEALGDALVDVLGTPGVAERLSAAAARGAAAADWGAVAGLTVAAYRRHLFEARGRAASRFPPLPPPTIPA